MVNLTPLLLLLLAQHGWCSATRATATASFTQLVATSPCLNVTTEDSCIRVSGCAWCSSGDDEQFGEGCMHWSGCTGPPGSCYVKKDEASCMADSYSGDAAENDTHGKMVTSAGERDGGMGVLKAGSSAEPAVSAACIWCKVEQRCVQKSNANVQCMGCDNAFDSGMRNDICGNCGGGCVDSFADFRNPFCGCLGCDNVLNSNLTMDVCGVCGGANSTCFPFQSLTKQERYGIALALCGNVLISVSLNTQKYAHNMNEADSGGARSYMELPMWWIGMILMTLGETGNFLAYAYAPATLVAPLGAITVISNCILAHYVLKENINRRNVVGVVLAIVGAVFIVTYAPSSDEQLTMDLLEKYMAEKNFVAYLFCLVATITSLFASKEAHKKRYVVIYILICSMTGSITVMCVKGVSTALILTFEGHNQFIYFVPWMLLVTTVGTILIQMKYLNLAMINFGASEVVPVYYVMFTFWSILGGMVLYKEYHQNCPDGHPDCHYTLWFLLGCAITFSGVCLITFASKDSTATSFGNAFGEVADAHETDGLLASDGGSDCDADDEEAGARNVSPSAMSSGLATSMQKVLHSRPSSQSDGNSGSGGGYLPSEL